MASVTDAPHRGAGPEPVRADPTAGRAAAVVPPSGARAWREHWPLSLLLAAYPLWWLLGLDSLLPQVLAVPMALQLLRRRAVLVPPGYGWWLLFLLWVVLGVAMLWVDAPGAVPGGGASRLLVFAFRLSWYVACGVVVLWVANLRRTVPDGLVHGLLAWMFCVCVAGGVLGLVAPAFEVTSLVESLLPRGVRGNEFVASLVHPEAADVQTVLGRPESRPKAPFPFTNTWGACLSITVVFFLVVLRRCGVLARAIGLVVLVVAAVPVMYSLNRGLWGSLALGVVGLVLVALRRGSRTVVLGVVVGAALAGVLLLASPLGPLYQDRLEHQHSNERRGQLLEATVDSVSRGSPVLGLGSTRDVEGSFASITGAATPDCPACGVPPLGTQGQLWLVVFAHGWVGLLFFLAFLVVCLARAWRCRTPGETVAAFVLAFLLLQLPVYDTLGLPLYLVMVAVGLVAREQAPRGRTVRRGGARTATGLVLVVVAGTTVVGAALGVGVARAERTPAWTSQVSILITPAPVYLDTGAPLEGGRLAVAPVPREVTVDTEAALLKSQRALRRAARLSGTSVTTLRDGVRVTAPPSSQVLEVTVVGATAGQADQSADAVASSYLQVREDYLERRRAEVLRDLREQLRGIGSGSARLTAAREVVSGRISYLLVSRPTIGRIIRRSPAEPVDTQPIVPVVSGAALGLLAGLLLLRRRRHHSPTSTTTDLSRSRP